MTYTNMSHRMVIKRRSVLLSIARSNRPRSSVYETALIFLSLLLESGFPLQGLLFFIFCYCSSSSFPPFCLSLFFLPHTPQLVGSQFTGRRWGMRPCGWVRSSGVTENVRSQEILIRVKYPRGSHLNTKTWPYPTACKLHFWKCQARQLARWE